MFSARRVATDSISQKRYVPRASLNGVPALRPWRYDPGGATGWASDGWFNKLQPTNWTKMIGQANIDADIAMMVKCCKDPRKVRIRQEIPWRLIETSAGVYDWSMTDYMVNALVAKGFVIHAAIWATPAWIGAANSLPSAAQFQSFCTAAITRYKNKIWIWEAWNEPLENNGRYLYSVPNNTNGQNYTNNLLNPLYTAAKAVDPSILVSCAGTGTSPANSATWITNIASGTAPNFDVMGFHDYPGSAGGVNTDYNTVRSQYVTTFPGKVPSTLWIDEYGVTDGGATNGAAPTGVAASWLQTVAPVPQSARTSDPASISWYNIRDEYIAQCGTATTSTPESALSTALTSGVAVTTLALNVAFGQNVATGLPVSLVFIDSSGVVHRQDFLLNGGYTSGATSITVTSQNANYSFPIGTQVILSVSTTQNPEAWGILTREGNNKGNNQAGNLPVFAGFAS